jgi:hypothetical protein
MVSQIPEVGQMVLAQSGWRAAVLGQVPSYFNDLMVVWSTTVSPAVSFDYASTGLE